jgi:hypothetical protein
MFSMTGKLHCSFCGKSEAEVGKLVAGPGGIYICDKCVAVCQALMHGEQPAISRTFDPKRWPQERLLALLKPLHATVDACREHLQTVVNTRSAQDVSWATIGMNLGVSRQTAWERFS